MEARATVSVFASVAATVLAIIYYVARLGFRDNAVLPVLETLCLSWFLIHFPFGCRLLTSRLGTPRIKSWMMGDGALTLLGLLLVTLAGLVTPVAGLSPVRAFCAVGAGFFIYRLISWLPADRVLNTLVLLNESTHNRK
jgi:hypothetical protein